MSQAPPSAEERAAIEAAIPHRPPFLFVDRVVEHGADSLRTEWRLDPEADWFRGHYPEQPITPGCLLSEHVFQSAAIFISRTLEGLEDPARGVPVLTKIENARFKRMVLPGETVRTEVRLEERLGDAFYMSGVVRVEKAVALRIKYVLTAVPPPPHVAGGRA